ncbi:MAG: HigA family addiction module antitoxin [Thiotrichaceae bacterium]|nr:HigA family addiction module antitoxin [Thiotrichaceae bacterium]
MYNPAHPGEILKELIIEPLELSILDVAEHLNINSVLLRHILDAQTAITPEIAIRLELAFNKPTAIHWLKLQNAYDLWKIRDNKVELNVKPFLYDEKNTLDNRQPSV